MKKIKLQGKIEELEEILSAIYDETESDTPDLNLIRALAMEGLGLDESEDTE